VGEDLGQHWESNSLLDSDLESNHEGSLDGDLDIVQGNNLLPGRSDGSYSALQSAAASPGASATAGPVQHRSRVRQVVRERAAVACVGAVRAAAGVGKP
jgi:hypothetical protein